MTGRGSLPRLHMTKLQRLHVQNARNWKNFKKGKFFKIGEKFLQYICERLDS